MDQANSNLREYYLNLTLLIMMINKVIEKGSLKISGKTK